MMTILVINSGSSSIKYKLLDMDTEAFLAEGLVERIGEDSARISHTSHPGTSNADTSVVETDVPDHGQGMQMIISLLTGTGSGVIKSASDIAAIGHRVVQGGEKFTEPVCIDDKVIDGIRANIPLAPLHNPGALSGILTALDLFPNTVQVAVFDTAFHQTIPPKAYRYAIPHEFYHESGVRRFGFHGTSHAYITVEAAHLLGKPVSKTNIISLHLGNGASITAVKNGRSVDTSMGMTPLDGVIMGTRCGAIDPAVIAHLVDHRNMTLQDVMNILTRESGLKGLCGRNDLRDIHQAIADGNTDASLALEMLIYRYRHFVGAYFAALGRVDAVVFTAGIGENDPVIREGVCCGMEAFGIIFDPEANAGVRGETAIISTSKSPVSVMVIPTNEELQIARQTKALFIDANSPSFQYSALS